MKDRLTRILRSAVFSILIFVQAFFFPAVSIAEDSSATDPADSTSQSAESEAQTGPSGPTGETQPTGADAHTFHENPETGEWENDYYIWNPITKQTRPKTPQNYSYNPETGMWDTTEYYFNPTTNRYEPNVVSVASNPESDGGGAQASISNTGPNSNNTIDLGGDTDVTFDLFYDARISNNVYQQAISGNAGVLGNTNGGNALSGDVESIANILNLLQSTWGELGSEELALFIANIDGDVVGDLVVDPNQLPAGSGNTDVDINVTSNSLIENDVEVQAHSGDATVSGNTSGGDAESGDATAVVNLINMINSAIRANRSFLGILNINGNLEGDILLPDGMLEAIIAATGPNSNNQINSDHESALDVTVDKNSTINNDLEVEASTGEALVTNNTTGGNATSGDADTSITLLNLTGKKVVAENALLVFVNVLGEWVGLIMDAPAGTSAVAVTGPNSNNQINSSGNTDVDIDVEENSTIDNDVHVSASSGDATVSGNTTGGDASSGNASAAINVVNMIDSEFELTDWFGVLFINVFGTWHGSFGVNTAFGNQPVATGGTGGGGQGGGGSTASTAGQTFRFVPRSSSSSSNEETTEVAAATSTTDTSSTATEDTGTPVEEIAATTTSSNGSAWILSGVAVLLGIVMLGGERLLAFFRKPPQS